MDWDKLDLSSTGINWVFPREKESRIRTLPGPAALGVPVFQGFGLELGFFSWKEMENAGMPLGIALPVTLGGIDRAGNRNSRAQAAECERQSLEVS